MRHADDKSVRIEIVATKMIIVMIVVLIKRRGDMHAGAKVWCGATSFERSARPLHGFDDHPLYIEQLASAIRIDRSATRDPYQ